MGLSTVYYTFWSHFYISCFWNHVVCWSINLFTVNIHVYGKVYLCACPRESYLLRGRIIISLFHHSAIIILLAGVWQFCCCLVFTLIPNHFPIPQFYMLFSVFTIGVKPASDYQLLRQSWPNLRLPTLPLIFDDVVVVSLKQLFPTPLRPIQKWNRLWQQLSAPMIVWAASLME